MNFNTQNITWRQLIGNGLTYVVPRFQRDYSWEEDQWDDFWQDAMEQFLGTGDSQHYMGYLVTQSNDNRTFHVIDGQQRIATLSLIAMAVLKQLKNLIDQKIEPENNQKRFDNLRATYIGYVDPVTLVTRPKLTLNGNNDGFYRDYIVGLREIPKRNLRRSERLIGEGFEWFFRKVSEEFGGLNDGGILARFLDTLSDRIFFTKIEVTDELNAYKVFETLNARGVRLSPTDLLKNYLFSVVQDRQANVHELDDLDRRWEGIVGELGEESFPQFLRVHWNSRNNVMIREVELYKTIRAHTNDREAVFQLIRNMEHDVWIYSGLSDPTSDLWSKPASVSIKELRMFGIAEALPLLLCCYRAFGSNDFESILKTVVVVTLRYNVVGGKSGSEQERAYAQVIGQILNGSLKTSAAVIRSLDTIYIKDDSFKIAFRSKELNSRHNRNKHIIKYILASIERHLTQTSYDYDRPEFTLEHVLPENPGNGWQQFSPSEHGKFLFRLGNFAILEKAKNRDLGNAEFDAKRPIYQSSQYASTRKIAEDNSEWTPERLVKRQEWMADQASSIWRLPQFD